MALPSSTSDVTHGVYCPLFFEMHIRITPNLSACLIDYLMDFDEQIR